MQRGSVDSQGDRSFVQSPWSVIAQPVDDQVIE
jgi:hypothetical protein